MGKSTRYAIEPNQIVSPTVAPMDDQGKQFVEAARELGYDESNEHYDDTVRNPASNPRARSVSKPKKQPD